MCASRQLKKTNQQITYTFRFGTTNEFIHITEEQLISLPYLSLLVTHDNDFVSIKNEDDEYVLDSLIRYQWFMPIFHAVTTQHPSVLFTELSEESHVCDMLDLYDYLCVNPIPIPSLKGQNLVRTKSDDIDKKNFRVEYSPVTSLVEIRDIAAQFIIGISKNEYDLKDSDTLNSVYSLIITILSNPIIFDVRLCDHMLTMIKYSYLPLFSSTQQHQLEQTEQSIERITTRSLERPCADGKLLLRDFPEAFVWKSKYVIIEDNHNTHGADRYYKPNKIVTYDRNSLKEIETTCKSADIDVYYPDFKIIQHGKILNHVYSKQQLLSSVEKTRENTSHLLPVLRNRPSFRIKNPGNKELDIDQAEQEQKEIERKSAGSDYLNKLPKSPKMKKFKHR